MDSPDQGALLGQSVGGGRYRLENAIGTGGMGSVYRAIRVSDGVPVAVKLLHPRLAREKRHVARFRREAEVAARLAHPHIVRVLKASGGDDSGPPILVMELLEGETLTDRIRARGKMNALDLIPIARQVLSALVAVHAIGLVHRDLKPANIILTRGADGRDHAKVIDFGLARLMESEGYEQLTQTGYVLGTPGFMPPEQALGDSLDERADVYAVGAVMYVALSGVLPYSGSFAEVVADLLQDARPRLRVVAPDVDPRLADIVETAMSFEPAKRFASVQALDHALSAIDRRAVSTVLGWRPALPIETLRAELARVDPPPRSRLPLGLVALSAAFGVLVVGLLLFGSWLTGFGETTAEVTTVADSSVPEAVPVAMPLPLPMLPASATTTPEPPDAEPPLAAPPQKSPPTPSPRPSHPTMMTSRMSTPRAHEFFGRPTFQITAGGDSDPARMRRIVNAAAGRIQRCINGDPRAQRTNERSSQYWMFYVDGEGQISRVNNGGTDGLGSQCTENVWRSIRWNPLERGASNDIVRIVVVSLRN